ncbi:MAG: peptidoglycan editing factor PgeF [Paraprevotella sp.]|nr:peptidoglycan editing factor PgeF [Paraprevotella sp.]
MYKTNLLTYDLGRGVCAFSTERSGGYSVGHYAAFNANAYCGDDECSVLLNRHLLCDDLGLDFSRLIIPHQVHADRVCRIDEDFFMQTEDEKRDMLDGVDAVITRLSQVCVSVSTADCIPVLLYDEAHHAVAAVHAGWRGTARHIPQVTLQAMSAAYGTRPSDVKAVIGPGISQEAFEVGDEVYEAFRKAGFPMEEIARHYPVQDAEGGDRKKWHIDLWRANEWLLVSGGVPADRIQVAGICTYLHSERFFSARRLGICSGRILNGIFLTE